MNDDHKFTEWHRLKMQYLTFFATESSKSPIGTVEALIRFLKDIVANSWL